MPRPIAVNGRIVIPEAAIEIRAARSSGPGGQHVNKVSSKIQMWIDLALVPGFAPGELERVRAALASRLDERGRLLVSSQATRDQARNVEDAAARVRELIGRALIVPKVRRPTRPTGASKERRIEMKRREAQRRKNRDVRED